MSEDEKKVTYQTLMDSREILMSISAKKVKPRLAYMLQKNLKLIQTEMNYFENARVAGLEAMGFEKDEKKGEFIIIPEKDDEWKAQYKELAETESGLIPHMIDLQTLEDSGVELSAFEMLQISWLIKE